MVKKSYNDLNALKSKLQDVRSTLNDRKSEIYRINDLISQKNAQLKTYIAEIKKLRKKRENFNKMTSEHKNEREQLKEKIINNNSTLRKFYDVYKKLRSKVDGNKEHALKKMQDLDWKIQTKVIPIKKETDMVREIEKLNRDLTIHNEIDEIDSEIKKIKSEVRLIKPKVDEAHIHVISNATKSKGTHERILELSKIITDIDNSVKEQIKKRNEINQEYAIIKAEFISYKKDINEIQAALHEEKTKKIAKENKQEEMKLRERADDALNRFKSGAKIEYDDMVLLQKFELL